MASLQAGSGQILKTIVDAKGDLIAGTAADTVSKLTAGANNTVLMADSGEATGLKWSASPIAVDTVWDAKGDLVVGTASNTAARLAVGAANTFPMVDAGETTGMKYALAPYHVCQGRLTLTTGVPVTTADVTAAATLYFTPYNGNAVGLFDGTYWDILSFTELSLDISGYTASKPYDIWLYNNSGTAALDSTIWTDGVTRATELTTQDGIYVKTGAADRRYLGTIYINSSGGQTDDSVLKRNVWNYYNRKWRRLYVVEATGHTYNSTTLRNWNNSLLALEVTCGVIEDTMVVTLYGNIQAGNAASPARIAMTWNASTTLINELPYHASSVTTTMAEVATKTPVPVSIGWNYISIMEQITAGSTNGSFAATVGNASILG